MLKRSFNNLASNPQKSWSQFKIGLAFFVFGGILIFVAQLSWLWLQLLGLLSLTLGCGIALVGYIGILAYRLSNAFRLPNARVGKDKKSIPPR